MKKYVVWFTDVDKDDVDIVGGKGANLGEMTRAGFPVPPGFIVTAQAYYHFLDENDLRIKIHDALSGLDVSDSKALDKVSKQIETLITRSAFPKEVSREIIHAYFSLEKGMLRHARVAVRSSATAEDLPGASFAGQQSTFLNVQGEANLIEKIKDAWASLFTSRAIFYRATQKFDHFKVGIAVPVQKMVESEASGIMFSIDPVTNEKDVIVIEAIYGLGEMIVQGAVTPDHYEVDKKTLVVKSKVVKVQEKKMVKKGQGNAVIDIFKKEGSRQKIRDEYIVELARLGKKLEHHYFFPQDIEWAIEKGRIYIVQTRPVTTIRRQISDFGNQTIRNPKSEIRNPILKGDPASPGMASGPVKILKSAKEIHKIQSGDVLVAEMTNPDYVPAMRKAVAIVTERGGRTSHAAIVSRELGIPAIVGAKNAMRVLKDGAVITVNGAQGEVYRGAITSNTTNQTNTTNTTKEKYKHIKTATKVYVNLAEPSRASVVCRMNADGIGLLRAEFMMAQIGTHPKKYLEDKKQHVFVDEFAGGIETICEAFNPRPVVYRASDFRTNEFRNLKGGDRYEPKEENPMLGFRGAARYIADPRVFEMELEAIKQVRNKKNLKNLHLMIPFVRSPRELLEVKKIVAGSGLMRSSTFKLWMMVELPTNVILIDQYLDVGIDGISFGSNDLTMLILGTDRDNNEVAQDFKETDDAVMWAFERVIKACLKRNVTTSMCGQAPSDYPELVEKLVRWGVTSISVNADVLDQVRETVYEAEQKLVQK
ncbi:phosphoenolpyruvate synthase [Candidatus Gottesmanbacteria bacterium]|nr:phosphoenolpyruvate synthase [Candidatus Gottesmanbacteria bacterium]